MMVALGGGGEPFWGLGYEWDPDWVLTDRQKELRATLIELCAQELRDNAKRSDDELLFPRRNLELLGEHGFLGLTVPEEYGGLGENHVAYAMTCETIARYGCASTAMCYVMHIGAVNAIMLRATEALIDKYIARWSGMYTETCEATRHEVPAYLDTLALAHAELGEFEQARVLARQAAERSRTSRRRSSSRHARQRHRSAMS